MGPGRGWPLLLSPGPFERKTKGLLKEWKEFSSQSLLWPVSWVKDAGGRNINDESCAPTADRIIKQAAHHDYVFQTIHKRRQRDLKEGSKRWCERSEPALSVLEKGKVTSLQQFTSQSLTSSTG